MQISEFEWDEGNVPHFELGHGIEPEEAEEVFIDHSFFRKIKEEHDVALSNNDSELALRRS